MESTDTKDLKLETLAWGLLFVWLGAWWGFLENGFLPAGSGALGVVLILAGLNGVRWFKGLPINILSATFGTLFLIVGATKLAKVDLACCFCSIPVFALFLIILGTIVIVRQFQNAANPTN